MKGWITSVCTTYALPPSLQGALRSKKKSFSWTKGFGDKGERRKKGFIRAVLGNTGGEFWIAKASKISRDNKQQGRAVIIHLLSYLCKQSICHNSTFEWIISCTPSSHNPFLPLVGNAGSIHLGCLFSLFSPSQLPRTFAFLDHFPLPNTAPLQSAQESDMLLFSIDLITELLFSRLKTNTSTNNVLQHTVAEETKQ